MFNAGAAELDTEFNGKPGGVTTFIAELQARAKKCHWGRILTFTDGTSTWHLLNDHGLISEALITTAHNEFVGYDEGTTAIPSVTASAVDHNRIVKDCIDRKMLHSCIEKTLTETYKRQIAVKIPSFKEDGVKFLHWLLKECSTTTTLATRDHKLECQTLKLVKCGNNINTLHLKFDTALFKVKQAGKNIEMDDQIMYHFEAYKTYTANEKFLNHISNFEGQWALGTITTVDELREKVNTIYQTLVRNKQWKTTAAETQVTALASETEASTSSSKSRRNRNNKDNGNTSNSDKSDAEQLKERNPKWKFKKDGNSTTLEKNNKTYNWCTGPGHFGVHMWVVHEAGSCSHSHRSGSSGNGGSSAQAHTTEASSGSSSGNARRGTKMSKSKFRAMVTEELGNANSFNDDLSGLINSIVSKAYE